MFEKRAQPEKPFAGTVLFVHGSSMASQPTFDLHVEGRPHSSVMDWFSAQGFDTWCVDMEGFGRSDKSRNINFDIGNGADDLAAASDYILKLRSCGPLLGLRHFVWRAPRGPICGTLSEPRETVSARRLCLDRGRQSDTR